MNSKPRRHAARAVFALTLIVISAAAVSASFGTQSLTLQSLLAPFVGSSASAKGFAEVEPQVHAEPAAVVTMPGGTLAAARSGHTATLLADGKVLIVGGSGDASAEIFDPATGIANATGNTNTPRSGHTATRLSDGRVLIAGGTLSEIYDPATGTFSIGPDMAASRSGHTATLLANGNVLIAGGGTDSAEIFNGTSFAEAGTLTAVRTNHSAAVMNDGRVFIAGGSGSGTAEIYNPADGTSAATGNPLAYARAKAHLRVLPDGKVQIIGGNNDVSMEVYDPAIDTIGAHVHLLPDTDTCTGLRTGVRDSQTRAALFFAGNADAAYDRTGHTITEIAGNQALVIGGTSASGASNAVTQFASSPATITTDKLDYAPGETVTFNGTNFAPGETVRVVIHEDPHTHLERNFEAVADASGNISGNYLVEEHDLNVKFIVNARGQTSNLSAQSAFTDGNPNPPTVTNQTPNPVVAGNAATFLVTMSFGGNAGLCTVNLSAATRPTPAWPAPPSGGFFTFSPTSVTGGNGSTPTSTLTINTPAGMGSNTYKFRVTATPAVGDADCQGGAETTDDIDFVVLADNTAPTVTINQATGQNDPTNISPVNFTAVFSEPVNNFAGVDIDLSGTAGPTTAVVTGGPTTYNVAVSGMTGNGTVTASIAANRATDAAGNQNTESTSTDNVVTYDGTVPTVLSITRNSPSPTNAGQVSWTVTFSESVVGADPTDFSTPSTGISGASLGLGFGSGNTYTFTRGTGNGSGTLGLNLDDNDTITDAAGNKLGGTGTGVAGGGGIGNGSVAGPVYTIDRTITAVIVANDKVYDGGVVATLVSCTRTSALAISEDVNVVCTSPTFDDPNVGTRTVTANVSLTGADAARYVLSSATASDSAQITAAGQTISVNTPAPATAVYGSSFSAAATGGASGSAVVIAASGACSGGGNSPQTITMTSGTGTCTVTYNQAGDANYNAAAQLTDTITAQKAELTVTASSPTIIFGDAAPMITPSYEGFVNGDDAGDLLTPPNCFTSYEQNNDAGEPYISVCEGAASNNYTFDYLPGIVTVSKATSNTVITCTGAPFTYNGLAQTPCSATVTGAGGLSQAVSVNYSNNTNAGTANASASFQATTNHLASSASTTFTIDKANVTSIAGSGSGTYNGAAQTPSACTVSGAYTGSLSCVNVPATVGPNVGTFTIVPSTSGSGLANFNVATQNGEYTISPAYVTATAGSGSNTYNGNQQSPSACVVSGDYIGGLSCANNPASVGPNVGTTAISPITTGADIGNFLVDPVAGSYTISPLAISVTPDNGQSKVYGVTPDPGLNYGSTPALIVGDTFTGSLQRVPGENVGFYDITQGTLALSPNYTLNFVTGVKFQITKANLTVTADDATREYGEANPTNFASTITGFVNGEVLATSGVLGSASCTSTALPTSPVAGIYSITCTVGTLTASNYAFIFASGNLEILRALLSINAVADSKTYGDFDPAFTYTLSGFKNTDDAGVTSGSATCDRAEGETVAGSTYSITCDIGGLSAANYLFAQGTAAAFNIFKRPVSVTPVAASKTYGETDPGLTGTLFNFMPADGVTAAYTRNGGDTVLGGPYTISATLSTASVLSNYEVTYNTAAFSITPKPASVTPNAASKEYGSADPVLSGTLAGFLSADNITATYSRAAGENVAGGPYAISAALSPAGVLSNYAITYNTASFTITAKAASVTPDPKTKVYGQADPALTGSLSGFLLGDGVTASYARTAGDIVANSPYTISATLSPVGVLSNYDITYETAAFTITPLAVNVTPDAGQSKIYGNADPVLTYDYSPALVSGDSFTGALSRVGGDTVGFYAITQGSLVLNDNYELLLDSTVNFEITKRDATWTTNPNGKIYGDAEPSPLTTGSGNFLAADNVTATYSRVAGETVTGGPYAITATLGPVAVLSNYNVTNAGAAFSINAKTASVTPNAVSKEYGSPDPAFSGTLAGFLAADSVTAAYSRNAGEAVLGGPYTISAVLSPAGVLTNYAITYNPASFAITPKAATWTTNPNSKIFGQADPIPLTSGIGSGFLPADNVTATYTRAPGEPVASYLITATLSPTAVLSNYTITNAGANFSIISWTLTGFYQPVGVTNTYSSLIPSPFVWNTIKGGQTVPLRFNVYAGTVEQTSPSIATFSVYSIDCGSSGTGTEDPVDFTTTGGTNFRYSGTSGVDGQFIQNWQSPSGPNKCYRVVMTTADSSRLVAFFKTKK